MKPAAESQSPGLNLNRLIRAVVWSQLLFTAGHALTSGGFYSYYVDSFGPTAFWLAVFLATPETAQAGSYWGRLFLSQRPRRKRLWIISLGAARLCALLIPMAAFWPGSDRPRAALAVVFLGTVSWWLLQGVAYLHYVSWLSDLAPQAQWGRLFSRRQLGVLISSGVAPLAVARLREWWVVGEAIDSKRQFSAVVFIVGGALAMLSIVPLWSFPEAPWRAPAPSPAGPLQPAGAPPGLNSLFLMRWWLAIFQGLTQAVFFKYLRHALLLPLDRYYLLLNLTLLAQIPLVAWAGRLSDRNRERAALTGGIWLTSLALPCWMLATKENWGWLAVAAVCWGGFGLVNVCGISLCLKLSGRSDNLRQVSLYDHMSGLLAGLAGIAGGALLDRWLSQAAPVSGAPAAWPYHWLFAISGVGRALAPAWLLLGRKSARSPAGD